MLGTDQHINYLKIRQHKATEIFLDTNLANGVIPTINKPTRVTHTSCILIDNEYLYDPTNNINHESEIFISDMSDNFPCLLSVETNKKEKKKRKFKLHQKQLNDKCLFQINNILLHGDWTNLYEKSVDDSCTTLIRKIYKTTDKVAPLKEIVITPKKQLHKKLICKSLSSSSKKCKF